MFNLFSKEKEKNKDESHLSLISVAALLIHSAKIDENYTEKEKIIIRKALIEATSCLLRFRNSMVRSKPCSV